MRIRSLQLSAETSRVFRNTHWVKSGPTSDALGPHLNQRFVYGSDSLSYSDVNVTRVMSCHTVEQTQHSNKHRNVLFFI